MKRKMGKGKFKKRDLLGWLVMLPSLVLFAFFIWEPLFENIWLSLYKTRRYELLEFTGLDNYILAMKGPDFFPAFSNTFEYIFWSLLIGFLTPMVVGILISETVHFRGLFRIGIYFPNIMPALATVWIWRFFFRPEDAGVLNVLLGAVGIEPQRWLTNPAWTIPLIIISLTWKSAGATALIYMANISSISSDLYEAATIDGAGIWQRTRFITLPSVFGLAKTLLILQIISVFQIMHEPLVMTNGGPNNASISIMMLVYRYAFRDFNFSAAAAISVMVCAVLVILSGIYMKLTASKQD